MFKLLFCQALHLFDLTLKTFLLTEILTMPTGLKMKREKTKRWTEREEILLTNTQIKWGKHTPGTGLAGVISRMLAEIINEFNESLFVQYMTTNPEGPISKPTQCSTSCVYVHMISRQTQTRKCASRESYAFFHLVDEVYYCIYCWLCSQMWWRHLAQDHVPHLLHVPRLLSWLNYTCFYHLNVS